MGRMRVLFFQFMYNQLLQITVIRSGFYGRRMFAFDFSSFSCS